MEINSAQRVGRIIRMLRDESGKTQTDVAKEAHCSTSLISYLESGQKSAHGDTLAAIGDAIGHRDVVLELWGFTTSGGYATAELLANYEAEASKIHDWEPRICPGLLQTPAYARAVACAALPLASEQEREEWVTKRIERQAILGKKDRPTSWFVLDEAVLYRAHGGKEVMREQLLNLEAHADAPNTVVQIMPFSAVRHPGLEGPLRIMEFSDKPAQWYTESWSSGKMTDAKDEVSAALTYFDLIRASAISPEQSTELIANTRNMRYE
jgi:transcriptional regulator with XRE-family HTH domain